VGSIQDVIVAEPKTILAKKTTIPEAAFDGFMTMLSNRVRPDAETPSSHFQPSRIWRMTGS
jgi:hypothetical protein